MSFAPLPKKSRRSTPRARLEVRAKVAHTVTQGRRIELFVTGPVMEHCGWQLGNRVSIEIGNGSDAGHLRISPSHRGLLLSSAHLRTKTARLCLYGDFLKARICAPVRPLKWDTNGAILRVEIPRDWLADIREQAALQVTP